jgi:hypothetical protein
MQKVAGSVSLQIAMVRRPPSDFSPPVCARNANGFAELATRNEPVNDKNPLISRTFRERLMGLEPTTFCMAIRSRVFGRSKKALQIGQFLRKGAERDARGLPAIPGDLANHWQTETRRILDGEAMCGRIWARNLKGRLAALRISGPRGAGGRVDFGQLPPPAQ